MDINNATYARKQFRMSDLNIEDTIVLDLEIQDPITSPEQWQNTHQIKISCCVIYSFKEDRYTVYDYTMRDQLALKTRILDAELVVGYNSNKFDLPVIFELPNRQIPPNINTFDILAEIWKALSLNPNEFTNNHRGYSLGNVAYGTLKQNKLNTGSNAPQLFRNGQWGKLITYCMDDVRLTRNLFTYMRTHQQLTAYRFGSNITIPFNFGD